MTVPMHFKSATLPHQGSDSLGTAAARGWVYQGIPWCTKRDQSSTEATSTERQSPWHLKHIFLFGLPNKPAIGLVCLMHTEEIAMCTAAHKEPALLLQRQSATVSQGAEVVANGEKLSGANIEPVRNFP